LREKGAVTADGRRRIGDCPSNKSERGSRPISSSTGETAGRSSDNRISEHGTVRADHIEGKLFSPVRSLTKT